MGEARSSNVQAGRSDETLGKTEAEAENFEITYQLSNNLITFIIKAVISFTSYRFFKAPRQHYSNFNNIKKNVEVI